MKNTIQKKQTNNLMTLLVLCLIGASSCQDEISTPSEPHDHFNSIKTYTTTIDYSKVMFYNNELLVFDTEQDLNSTVENLESQYEEHDDWFLNQHDSLSIDSINAVEDSIGHNHNLPYEDFESNFTGFSSLRQDIIQQEDNWLATATDLDIASDPDNHFIQTDGFRAILNPDNEVATLNKVYKFYEDFHVEITGPGLDTLLWYKDSLSQGVIDPEFDLDYGQNNFGGTLGIIILKFGNGSSSAPGCSPETNRRSADFEKNTTNNRKIKWVVWIENRPGFNMNVHSKTKGYKKWPDGQWRKYRSTLYARVHGQLTNTIACEKVALPLCHSEEKKKRKIQVNCVNGLAKAVTGEVKGSHLGAEGIIKKSVLTW